MDCWRRLSRQVMAIPVTNAVSLLLLCWFATGVRCLSRPADGHERNRRTMNVEAIVKEAERLRYPIDDYWLNFQETVPEYIPFPCEKGDGKGRRPRWRSKEKPTSVHRLRPGDIDVVGAIGDSITAAIAAREYIISLIQDRGVSFTGGGLGTWRTIMTMPNILKEFNPNLVGYAVGRGDFLSYNAQLNVAIISSLDDDALTQAKLFVKKMKLDPRINFKEDWKVLSILNGHNDVCSMNCLDNITHSPEAHKQQLQKALNYLYKEVPRIYVNVIPMIDPSINSRIETNGICKQLRRFICSCLYRNDNFTQSIVDMSKLVYEYHEAEKELVYSGIYSGREDFTVELQSFLRSSVGPTKIGDPDNDDMINFFNREKPWTPDCFHFNQKGMAIASLWLWKNMMEPAGKKHEYSGPLTYKDIKCPTKSAPYLFTQINSKKYFHTGEQ